MSRFIITVPGTFLSPVTPSAVTALQQKLASLHTDVSENEGLDLLTRNEDNTFSVRLEIEAPDRYEAELDATRLVAAALRGSGVEETDAPLGPPAVTGIDSEL
ncbi:hypothetical protein [Streptomyces sp. 184]|uniref:hypothetical protein n=1 Tax=Streptomyces sp. 184 TaxID=1827526 RepID=UPI00389203FD